MERNMTIREIANLANTSRGTVDRVLNHRGNVAEDVRQRIEKVICETGYVAKSHLKKDGKKHFLNTELTNEARISKTVWEFLLGHSGSKSD